MVPQEPNEPESGGRVVSKAAQWMSPEEYLAFERAAETKHEYYAGQVFALAGASERHNLLVVNLIYHIRHQLGDGPCRVYPSDLRLKVPATGLYTYPDVAVVCGTTQLEDEHFDTLLNPSVLIEVLSESTEKYDRGRQAEHYRSIATLQEYLLVSQDQPRVEHYLRNGEREWVLTEAIGVEARVELVSVGCVLPVRDVYDKVF